MEKRWISMLFIIAVFPDSVRSSQSDVQGIHLQGDILIGGLFPVHGEGTQDQVCASINRGRGIQRLEAMRFAIQRVNKDETLLKGVTLGMQILDTCSDATYALDQSIEFVMSTLAASWSDNCPTTSNKTEPRKSIVAVIGAAYSSVSIQIANLLRLFQIPQISYASTSAELSIKDDFFMRTVPPDTLQAKALVDIVSYFNWTYVSTVASDDNYGISGIDSFKEYYLTLGQCIAIELKVPKRPDDKVFLDIVKKLYKARSTNKAKVVILFVGQDHAEGILKAATALGYHDDFIWLASDGWGNGMKPVEGNEQTAEGALTVTLKSNPISDFDSYFRQLTPANNQENIWFDEYWEATHNCTFQRSPRHHRAVAAAPYGKEINEKGGDGKKVCTGNERDDDYKQESKVQFVFDAVYAVALGLDRLYKEICGADARRLCGGMNLNSTMRAVLNRYIRENQQDDPFGNAIRFDENGDSLGFYSIMNYRMDNGSYDYVKVGSWEDNLLELKPEKVEWPGPDFPNGQIPMSFCSLDCELGYRKDMMDDKQCCWKCLKCEPNEFLRDEFTCERCPEAYWPHDNMTGCRQVEVDYVQWDSFYAIIPGIFSFIGLIATIFTIVVFIIYVETPVVKAAGRELSFMLLAGCVVCYLGVFILLIKPSDVSCVIQRFFLGAGFTIVYSALLTKTNRIYRIFTSAKKTTKRPAFISPKSQLAFASILAAVQIVVFAIWLVVEEPKARIMVPDDDKPFAVLKCNWEESSLLISLTYNMLLIIVCTVYAVLTRKIPSSFNESKFIGFTMYTTCIIWLSFCPVYFGLKSSYKIQVTTLCSAIMLSATVALVCLFGPKLYIIILHPMKNKRKSTTERTKFSYGTSKQCKADTDQLVSSPSRSRTSSTATPLANGHSSKKLNYELKDQTIPEEINLISRSSLEDSVQGSENLKLSQDSHANNNFDSNKSNQLYRQYSIESEESRSVTQLPYVDESEDSTYKQISADPLDLHNLKDGTSTGSTNKLNGSFDTGQITTMTSPAPQIGETYNSNEDKPSIDINTNGWRDDQNEADELPERLI